MRLLAAAAAALLSGCSYVPSMPSLDPTEWFRSAPASAKPAELPPLSNPQAVRVLWTASVGSAGRFAFVPALAGGDVYAAGSDGTVVRLDGTTGQTRWRVGAGSPLSAGVGSDGRIAVVATDHGEVFALDAENGTVRWKARVSSEVLAPPKVGEGLVLVRSADNRVFAFGADDGKRRWVYQRAAPSLTVRSPTGLTLVQGSAYAGFPGGKLVAIALSNGAPRWEATVALPKGSTELERVTDVVGEPAAQGRAVCAAAFQGRVACFDAQNGKQLWARDLSTIGGVSFDSRYAYVSDDRGAVHAMDRSNGRSVWKQDRLANRRLSLPVSLEGEVVFGDFQGQVHFAARESGAFVARFATDGSGIRAAPLRLTSGVLVQTANGGLYALSL